MNLIYAVCLLVACLFAPPRGEAPAPAGPVGADGVIGLDRRRLLPEFAVEGAVDEAAARAGLGATHRLTCGASASLVGHADVIVFSAHQLLDGGRPDPDVASCMFVVARGGEEERYPILLDTLDHGDLIGSGTALDPWDAGNQQDWSVARLARPVPGVVPYRLPEAPPALDPGTAVTAVSEITENWHEPSKNTDRLAEGCRAIPMEEAITDA